MPRLGSDNNDGNEGEEEGRPLLVLAATTAPPRTASTAYAASAGNSRHWQELTMKLLMLMTLTYIARNALFHVRTGVHVCQYQHT